MTKVRRSYVRFRAVFYDWYACRDGDFDETVQRGDDTKNVRDDEGFWHSIEQYFSDNSEAEFSHSICPNCMSELYPTMGKHKKKDA